MALCLRVEPAFLILVEFMSYMEIFLTYQLLLFAFDLTVNISPKAIAQIGQNSYLKVLLFNELATSQMQLFKFKFK